VKPASQPVNLDDVPRLDAFEPHLGKAYAPTRRRLDPPALRSSRSGRYDRRSYREKVNP
jgi:hypothetical protein